MKRLAVLLAILLAAPVYADRFPPNNGTKTTVVAKTAAYTTSEGDTNYVFTNTGASGSVTITLLDNPPAGVTYSFVNTVAQNFVVRTSSGESLYLAGTVAACTTLTGSAIGSAISIVAVTGGSGAIWAAAGGGFVCA